MPNRSHIEAYPRTAEEIASLNSCPDVLAAAKQREIKSVVHFTTLAGVIGVLATGSLKSRARLPKDKYLEHVYKPNSQLRKDQLWLDYVNLSIERINDWMFDASSRWHAADGNPWVVLSFHPTILSHAGVIFTTTNNIYPSCRRSEGLHGFCRLFGEPIEGRFGRLHRRDDKLPAWATDRQAEVLYPGELSCKYLQRIDVQLEEAVDSIHGVLGGLSLNVSVRHAPEVFS